MIIDLSLKSKLLAIPLFTPVLIAASGVALTALFLRCDSLDTFRQAGLRMQVAFAGFEHDGNCLACVAFRVFDRPDDPLEGDAYLNPRQAADRDALKNLILQTQIPLVFLSKNLKEQVAKAVTWQTTSQAAARDVFERSASVGVLAGSFDPEFQKAKECFQSLYTVKSILDA